MKLGFTSDWQVRRTRPVCRNDKDWVKTMVDKINFIFSNCDSIIVAGDIFETNPTGEWIKAWLANTLYSQRLNRKKMYAIFGQHDLMYHSLKRVDDTGLMVLGNSKVINIIKSRCAIDFNTVAYPMHWGDEVFPTISESDRHYDNRILVVHRLLVKDSPKSYGGESAKAFLRYAEKKGFNIVLSGDNHESFYVDGEKGFLYNSGSLFRLKADQIDHTPQFGVYDTETGDFEIRKIPITKNSVTRKHIQEADEENINIIRLMDELEGEGSLNIDFVENLNLFFEREPQRPELQSMVFESLIERRERRSQ